MTAYRNDIDALAAREEVLAKEVAEKQREHADLQVMLEEARAAEAAEAREHDVMVGKRRLRRIVGASAIILAVGVAAAGLVITRDHQEPVTVALAAEATLTAPDLVKLDAVLAGKGLERIELEPRFPTGLTGVDSEAEAHAAVGEAVEPWQQFNYTRDASVRPAVASPLYRGGEMEPTAMFARDASGGVWRLAALAPEPVVLAPARIKWSRKVWLLPQGTSFRGDLAVAYPR